MSGQVYIRVNGFRALEMPDVEAIKALPEAEQRAAIEAWAKELVETALADGAGAELQADLSELGRRLDEVAVRWRN